jgi:hypothetical protein
LLAGVRITSRAAADRVIAVPPQRQSHHHGGYILTSGAHQADEPKRNLAEQVRAEHGIQK